MTKAVKYLIYITVAASLIFGGLALGQQEQEKYDPKKHTNDKYELAKSYELKDHDKEGLSKSWPKDSVGRYWKPKSGEVGGVSGGTSGKGGPVVQPPDKPKGPPYKGKVPPSHTKEISETWPADHNYDTISKKWPAGHNGENSPTWPKDPNDDHYKTGFSLKWPKNHDGKTSPTWPKPGKDHDYDFGGASKAWPGGHDVAISPTWPKDHDYGYEGLSSKWPADHQGKNSPTWPKDHDYTAKGTSPKWPKDHLPEKSKKDEEKAKAQPTPPGGGGIPPGNELQFSVNPGEQLQLRVDGKRGTRASVTITVIAEAIDNTGKVVRLTGKFTGGLKALINYILTLRLPSGLTLTGTPTVTIANQDSEFGVAVVSVPVRELKPGEPGYREQERKKLQDKLDKEQEEREKKRKPSEGETVPGVMSGETYIPPPPEPTKMPPR